jgi:[ribosomal protein S18]-alanine N-acetyltransferase
MMVRLASSTDVEAVIQLERTIAEAPHWAASEYSMMLAPALGSVRRCLFVAESDRGLVGFAVGKVIGMGLESSSELESVAVSSDARRTGVGRSLCAAVIEWCRTQGAVEIELEVRAASAGAIALYSGLGFVVEGGRPGYYREPTDDAVLMRLKLA